MNPQPSQNNLKDEAIQALSHLDQDDQEKVLEYIQALVESQKNEQGEHK